MTGMIDNPFKTLLTNTSLFLLPPLQIEDELLDRHHFWNAYLGDVDHVTEETDEHLLYCLFKPVDTFIFEQLIDQLDRQGILVDDYDYEDGFCVLVLKFPKEYNNDFELIVQGKYSQTSGKFQSLFPMDRRLTTEEVLLLKDQESILSKEEYETLRESLVETMYKGVFKKTRGFKKLMEDYFQIDVDSMGKDFEYWTGFENSPSILSIDRILGKTKK